MQTIHFLEGERPKDKQARIKQCALKHVFRYFCMAFLLKQHMSGSVQEEHKQNKEDDSGACEMSRYRSSQAMRACYMDGDCLLLSSVLPTPNKQNKSRS